MIMMEANGLSPYDSSYVFLPAAKGQPLSGIQTVFCVDVVQACSTTGKGWLPQERKLPCCGARSRASGLL